MTNFATITDSAIAAAVSVAHAEMQGIW